jgi:anthranilate synthase component 2
VLLLIDNFDSFSHILADNIRQTGAELTIVRNDVPLKELKKLVLEGIILSPGPGIPKNAGHLMEILDHYHGLLPILGICLGHQAIGEYFGAKLIKSKVPVHGKITEVRRVHPHPLLVGIPESFKVTRYHSLEVCGPPPHLEVFLATRVGEIMAMSHTSLPIIGIQYHPEAYLTEYGLVILRNWVNLYVKGRYTDKIPENGEFT